MANWVEILHETFTSAISANWKFSTQYVTLGPDGNGLGYNPSGQSNNVYLDVPTGDNQYTEFNIHVDSFAAPMVRYSDVTGYFYYGGFINANRYRLWKQAGVDTINWDFIYSRPSVPYKTRLEVEGTTLRVYANDLLVGTINDTSNPLTSGKTGLYVGSNQVWRIDDLRVGFELPPLPPSSKRLLVADDANSRIAILDLNMALVNTFGSYGNGNGQFAFTVDACSNGVNIFATDAYSSPSPGGHRIQKFDMDGNYVSHLGDPTRSQQYDYGNDRFSNIPFGIAFNGTNLYVSDRTCSLIKKYNINTLTLTDMLGRYDWTTTSFNQFSMGHTIYNGTLYVIDANLDGSLLAVEANSTFAIKGGARYADTGLFGGGVHADSTHIYVHNRLAAGQPRGALKYNRTTLALEASVATGVAFYGGICGDSTYIYVLETVTNTTITKRLKSDLSFVASYPDYGDIRDLSTVHGCAVDNNYVYVCDYNNGRIVRIDKATMQYHSDVYIGGQHGWPQYIALDSTYMYIMSFGSEVKVAKYDIATITLQALSSQSFSATGSHYIALDEADPDNSDLFVIGQYGSGARVLDRATLDVKYTGGSPGDPIAGSAIFDVNFISLTPDGTKLVCCYMDLNVGGLYNIKVFDTSTWAFLGEYAAANFSNTPLACYSNTEFLMWNDNTYTLELRNITTFALVNSIVLSIANGFPADSPSIWGIGYESVSNKIFLSETNSNNIWRLNGSTLAFEVASSGLGLSFPINIQVYDAEPAIAVTNTYGQVIW